MKRIRFKHTWMRCLALFISGYILGLRCLALFISGYILGYGLFGAIDSCPEPICFLYLTLALIGTAFLTIIDV